MNRKCYKRISKLEKKIDILINNTRPVNNLFGYGTVAYPNGYTPLGEGCRIIGDIHYDSYGRKTKVKREG